MDREGFGKESAEVVRDDEWARQTRKLTEVGFPVVVAHNRIVLEIGLETGWVRARVLHLSLTHRQPGVDRYVNHVAGEDEAIGPHVLPPPHGAVDLPVGVWGLDDHIADKRVVLCGGHPRLWIRAHLRSRIWKESPHRAHRRRPGKPAVRLDGVLPYAGDSRVTGQVWDGTTNARTHLVSERAARTGASSHVRGVHSGVCRHY
mmetsp:Transcript_64471/g.178716  ORF Transcript_64471/g.178716 Transcript_64471/m.178716 type:complete len:203 (-) Transcript_64471:315-923(-)